MRAAPEAVVLFAEDPGAVNSIVPLALELERRGIAVRLLCDGHATGLLEARGIAARRVTGESDARAEMLALRPGCVVVGMSENARTCAHALVAAAREAAIPSIGVVDFAANAAFRFRGANGEALEHAPDALLVPDEWTASEYAAIGFRSHDIVVAGHPHYDVVREARARLDAEGRERIRTRVFPEAARGRTVLVFVSEISTGLDALQYRRSQAYTLAGRGGSDERTAIVLEELLIALDTLAHEGVPRPYLVLRLHPKETSELTAYAREVDHVSRGGSALEVVYAADVAVGMSSMLLLEAHLLGVPTLSIVPRALERDWLPTTRTGDTPCAQTRTEVTQRLRTALCGARRAPPEHSGPRANPASAAVRMADAVLERAAANHR